MVKEIQYTSINRVLDDLLEDPHMENLTLEQVVRHTIRFICKHGYPRLYQDKQEDIEIHEFRGLLPCDLISIIQVKDKKTHICLRAMTDTFYPPKEHGEHKESPHHYHPAHPIGEPFRHYHAELIHPELAFKTQGMVIYTSFPEGMITVAYKAIPVDEHGFPLLIDNQSYLDALESYIAMKVIRNKFRKGDLQSAIYQDAKQEYALAARELLTEMTTPSMSEMEAMTRMFNTLIPRVREFDTGFRDMGDREYIKNQYK